MKSGLKPIKHDFRDYDFLKNRRFGAVSAFPSSYSVDAGLWVPDQTIPQSFFGFFVPAIPEGCTDYAQSDLLADEDKRLYNPMDIEAITHANANGGTDIRTALKAAVALHKDHPAYFNVKSDGTEDSFDTMRLALILGEDEGRAISVGTPWYQSFFNAPNGIVAAPLSYAVTPGVTWHNWVICGWKTINGSPYLIGKPWVGTTYADKGFFYFSREIINNLMLIPGSAAFVLDKLLPGEKPNTVSSNVKQLLVSFFWYLFGVK